MRVIAIILLVLFCQASWADGYMGLVGLSPSDKFTKKPVLTLGIGTDEWIFSLGIIFNSQYSDDDFQDSPIPHTDYTDLGEQRIGNTMGFDLVRSYRFEDTNISIFAGGGFYFGTNANLVRSNVTGWLWAQNKKSKTDLGLEAGALFGPIDETQFGVSYHTVKGVSLYLRAGTF